MNTCPVQNEHVSSLKSISKFKGAQEDLTFLYAGPTVSPTGVVANATGPRCIHVQWNAILGWSRSAIPRGYRVSYETVDSTQVAQTSDVTNTLNQDFVAVNLTGLKEFTRYNIQVAALSSKGIGPWSEVLLVQTNEDGKGW